MLGIHKIKKQSLDPCSFYTSILHLQLFDLKYLIWTLFSCRTRHIIYYFLCSFSLSFYYFCFFFFVLKCFLLLITETNMEMNASQMPLLQISLIGFLFSTTMIHSTLEKLWLCGHFRRKGQIKLTVMVQQLHRSILGTVWTEGRGQKKKSDKSFRWTDVTAQRVASENLKT